MIDGARYGHTNLIAQDWRRLVAFYVELFGCEPVPPERDLRGPVVEAGTGVPGGALAGMHLRLPGHGPDGPTLEIYSFAAMPPKPETAIDRPGYGHLAFQVTDVVDARAQVLAAGGRPLGEVVRTRVSPDASVTWCYVTDPEGNPVELQSWGPGEPAAILRDELVVSASRTSERRSGGSPG